MQDKTGQAAEAVVEFSKEAGEVVVEKGKEVGSFTKEVAVDVKDSVFKDAEAEKKRQEEEERKNRGGLFGLFGRRK